MSTAVRPASVRPRHTLRWALLISLAVHAVVLSVRFIHPRAFDDLFQAKTLDIVLVNARSDEKPVQAQALAQHNLAGDAAVEQNRRAVEQLQQQQRVLLDQVRAQLSELPARRPQNAAKDADQQALEERRERLLRLLATIERRIQEENERPQTRYLSPATVGVTYALYYDAMRRKIEAVGTRIFPRQNGRKLYGELLMALLVDNDGQLLATHVVRGSGNAELDRQAEAIAQRAGPFGPFTPAMRRDTDRFDITLVFHFTHQSTLTTGGGDAGKLQ